MEQDSVLIPAPADMDATESGNTSSIAATSGLEGDSGFFKNIVNAKYISSPRNTVDIRPGAVVEEQSGTQLS